MECCRAPICAVFLGGKNPPVIVQQGVREAHSRGTGDRDRDNRTGTVTRTRTMEEDMQALDLRRA